MMMRLMLGLGRSVELTMHIVRITCRCGRWLLGSLTILIVRETTRRCWLSCLPGCRQVVWILRLDVLERFVRLAYTLIELRTRCLYGWRLTKDMGIRITVVGCISLGGNRGMPMPIRTGRTWGLVR